MKTESETIRTPRSTPPATSAVSGCARFWPAVVLVSLFWVAFVVVGSLEKPYFIGFLYSMAAPTVLLLLYSIWWWCNRRIAFVDRVYGCLLVILTGVAVAPLCHKSIWFGLPTNGLPLALTVLTLWMLVTQWTGFAWRRLGLLVLLALSWGYFALIRVDGVNADLQGTTRWRWTPTAEELFLAERARATNAPSRRPLPASHAPLTLSAGDWPAFRGPERDGVIPGITIATDWSTAPPKLLWRRRVGPGWSSVIVMGDRVFTQEQRGEEETVVCYEASTGNEVWVHADSARFWEAVSGAGPRATTTPVTFRSCRRAFQPSNQGLLPGR